MKTGSVYIIKADGMERYKIGHSQNVQERFKTISAQSPIKLELVAYVTAADRCMLEGWIHKEFEICRHHGEWFDLDNAALTKAINMLEDHENYFESKWIVTYGMPHSDLLKEFGQTKKEQHLRMFDIQMELYDAIDNETAEMFREILGK